MIYEYHIFSYIDRSGSLKRRLINTEALVEDDVETYLDFFEPGCREIVEQGVVQVMGDTDFLDDVYQSE